MTAAQATDYVRRQYAYHVLGSVANGDTACAAMGTLHCPRGQQLWDDLCELLERIERERATQ